MKSSMIGALESDRQLESFTTDQSTSSHNPASKVQKSAHPDKAEPTRGGAEKLLDPCWGDRKGVRFTAWRNPIADRFTNKPVKSPTDSIEAAIEASDAGYDVYFAPAEFKTAENRKAENATGAGVFWIDVDVGEEKADRGRGYPTVEEALNALAFFFVAVGIPEPTHVVLSGTGFHVYWVLERHIGRELWLNLARKLKDLAEVLKFRADPCRTADIASLMRVPGTLNHKTSPPLPVELLQSSDDRIPVARMADPITEAHERLITTDATASHKGYGHCENVDIALLQAILACLDPDMEYPDWFRVAAALFNLAHGSESAYQLFDDWSRKGQKYRGPEETLRKWDSLQPDHPNPVGMATLRMMVKDAGFDWERDVIDVADCARNTVAEV